MKIIAPKLKDLKYEIQGKETPKMKREFMSLIFASPLALVGVVLAVMFAQQIDQMSMNMGLIVVGIATGLGAWALFNRIRN